MKDKITTIPHQKPIRDESDMEDTFGTDRAFIFCLSLIALGLILSTFQYFRENSGLFTEILHEIKEYFVISQAQKEIKEAREERAVKAVVSDPIPSGKFLSVYRQRRQGKQLAMEFKALGRNQEEHTTNAAMKNVLLNNKQDVVPYDHSRVLVWDRPDSLGTDYHNASYIDGYNGPKEYIASQGPSTKCLVSFWHLIWQEGVTCVVMATGLFENAVQQCDKYWVDHARKHVQHGSIHIWHERSIYLAHLNIRTFRIQKEGSIESRVLTHFEMVGFHDESPDPGLLLDVRRRVDALSATQPGPVLVHCRCGGSRTAVYIAVDFCLHQLQSEDRVDVYSTVLHLRRFRKNMVRTLSQYKQIYNTVAMYLQCGLTVYPADTLTAAYHVHYAYGCDSKHQRLEKEFQTLQSVVPRLSIGDCASGHRVENRSKSRDIMLLPPECARPYLSTVDCGDSGTDFINAVYINGYHSENSYLVTQWPMKKTTGDFWRLVYDFKISSVVFMNDPQKFTRNYPRFWPKEVNQIACYGPISVTYVSFEIHSSIVTRTFAIRKPQRHPHLVAQLKKRDSEDVMIMNNLIGCELRKDEIVVKMFQVLNSGHRNVDSEISHLNNSFVGHTSRSYSSSRTKTGTSGRGQRRGIGLQSRSLLALMEHVTDWQKISGSRHPICIISKDGSSRVGLYCTVAVCCDQFRVDREVDVFNAVRHVRKNRPQLVPNIEEYRFIYHFMTEFITLAGLKPDIIVSDPLSAVLPHCDNERITISAALPNSIHGGVYVVVKAKGSDTLTLHNKPAHSPCGQTQREHFFSEPSFVNYPNHSLTQTSKQNGGLLVTGRTVPCRLDHESGTCSVRQEHNQTLPPFCFTKSCDNKSSADTGRQFENKVPVGKTTGNALTYGQILSCSTLQPLGDIHHSPSDMSITRHFPPDESPNVNRQPSSLNVQISSPERVSPALSPSPVFLTPERHQNGRVFSGLRPTMTSASLSPGSLCKSSSFYSCKSTLSISSNCLANGSFFSHTENFEIHQQECLNGHCSRASPARDKFGKHSTHSIYTGLSSSLSASDLLHPHLSRVSACQRNNGLGYVKRVHSSCTFLNECMPSCTDGRHHSSFGWIEHDRQVIKAQHFNAKPDLPKTNSAVKVHSDQQPHGGGEKTITDKSVDKTTSAFTNNITASKFNLKQKLRGFRSKKSKKKFNPS